MTDLAPPGPARLPESGEQRIRAFFAVELGETARLAAAEVADRLAATDAGRSVGWVRAENYHLTLRFLGELEGGRVPELQTRVGAEISGRGSFEVGLGPVMAFPDWRRPRVIALGLEPEASLEALAADVERGVVAARLPAEHRRFRSHVTLGRIRERERDRRIPSLEAVEVPRAPFLVDEVVLFRSILGPRAARYTPLARLTLGETSREDDAGPDRLRGLPPVVPTHPQTHPEGAHHGQE